MIDYELYIFHVNRDDLLQKAVFSAEDVRQRLTVVDNSMEGTRFIAISPMRLFRPSVPLSASQSFNWAMKSAKGAGKKFILIMHEDAEAHPGTFLKLVELVRELTDEGKKWGVVFTNYDCLAALNLDLLDDVGLWDTNLPQYYTDNDFYRRLELAGYEKVNSNLPVSHVGSQTINSDPERGFMNSITFPLYGSYYEKKWGGSPGHETFLTPFNR